MARESDLCLILPTLNERENIVSVVRSVLAHFPSIGQILVVDDNSSDGTREAVSGNFAERIKGGQLSVIRRTINLGLTSSLRDAVRVAKLPLVGWMDCDGSMPVEKLADLLAAVESGYDIAVASRFVKGGNQKSTSQIGKDSRSEIWLSNFLNGLLHRIFQMPVSDLTSGFIVMRASAARQIRFRGSHGEYFIFLLLQAQHLGLSMIEIPYNCGTRQHGESKTFGSLKNVILNTGRYSWAFVVAVCSKRKAPTS